MKCNANEVGEYTAYQAAKKLAFKQMVARRTTEKSNREMKCNANEVGECTAYQAAKNWLLSRWLQGAQEIRLRSLLSVNEQADYRSATPQTLLKNNFSRGMQAKYLPQPPNLPHPQRLDPLRA